MGMDADLQQLDEQGKDLYKKKDYQAAAVAFSVAAQACLRAGDETMAAEMRNNQSVALLQIRQYQAALEAVLGTEAVFARAGDSKRQGMALANQAAALERLKKKEEAAALYEQAAELLAQVDEGELRADVLRSLAALKVRKGEGLEAVIAMQDGLAGVKKPTFKQRLLKALLKFRV